MAERIEAAPVPDEPPPMSVVVDRHGLAWQRLQDRWLRALDPGIFPGARGRDWPRLLWDHGPVDLVHRAPVDAEEADTP